ncbi:ice-binding family protein [Aeromicrobium fastidiosum]|uniref:DUF3494 domain-containing protein n=1 Tax=Aeromicrobium fastidiosum TaxID=52699 RepID=A0A641ARA6_9ACTN|nr:ice-binding family protein [Aeromicrobium fastidiosum]KAA1380047.1 DUF3494 domain-containing protein [Aeromicrobium fastidiosum]MBP2389573.1 putative membrane protein YgcG [Aeromicrobium fastidiosum]
MTTSSPLSHPRLTLAAAATGLTAVLAVAAVSFADTAHAAGPPDPDLGGSAAFSVLAGEGVANTGPTTIAGLLGSAGIQTTVTGGSSITPAGNVLAEGSSVTSDAKADLLQGYGEAATAPTVPNPLLLGEIGGQTLTGGTYTAAQSLGFTSTLTLDGENDPNSVFIIQVGQDFDVAGSSQVVFTRGAQACHLYWQIGNDAVIGVNTAFKGTILAGNDIVAKNGATFQGRLLSNVGAITLDSNTFTSPTCAAATTPAPVVTTPAPVATTPVPTTKPTPKANKKPSKDSDRGSSGGDSDSDGSDGSDGGSGSDGSDGTSGAGTDTDGGTDGGSSTTSGLPDAGGPPLYLAPVGALTLLTGAGLVLAARRRVRGTHRA